MLEGLVVCHDLNSASPSTYLSVLLAKLNNDPGNLILWALFAICQ